MNGSYYDFVRDRMVSRIDPERAMELHKDGRTDKEIAKALGVSPTTVANWRRGEGLKFNTSKKNARCRTCTYWKNGCGSYTGWAIRFCHCYLDTGKRRQYDEDGKCFSYRKRAKNEQRKECIPAEADAD